MVHTIALTRETLVSLLKGRTRGGLVTQRTLFALSISVLILYIVESFYPRNAWFVALEIALGVLFFVEYLARLYISPRPFAYIAEPLAIIDFVVIISLLSPLIASNLIFLRSMRSLQLLRSYHLFPFFAKKTKRAMLHYQLIVSLVNFTVFLMIATGLVYNLQAASNPEINNYLDALYFTVTTLTTTGFGDIVPSGLAGRLVSVLIMVFGVTLFINLARNIFQPPYIYYRCTECGLTHHLADASHCRHCGSTIKNDFRSI